MDDEIDFESEDVENLVTSFSEVVDKLNAIDLTNLTPCSYISNLCASTLNDVTNYQKMASAYLESNTIPIMDILENMKVIDEMGDGVFDFSDIILLMQLKKQGTKVYKADEEFFRSQGWEVIDGVLTIDGPFGTYQYDIQNGKLFNPDGTWLHVNYYIPEKIDDVSNLNTITCLAGQGEDDVDSPTGANSFHLDTLGANSIIVCPSKKGQMTQGIDNNKASYSFMSQQVINSTKFATMFSRQKPGCQNSIGGCSSGGGSALKIASQAGNLYDTVFCINYAPLIAGKNDRGKGINGADDNRLTEEQALDLNGKNLLFISSSSDPNIEGDHNSFMYTGLDLLLQSCPDAQIFLATNRKGSTFKNIQGNNYHYLGDEFWKEFAKENYTGHGSYHGMFNDLINSGILGSNDYNTNM